MSQLSEDAKSSFAAPPADLTRRFRVGKHVVDPTRRVISRNEHSAQVNPRDLEVLRELARRPGKVVSKRALMAAVWGDQIVSEGALTNSIHQLRKAFDDSSKEPKYIRTVHRQGYELVAEVSKATPSRFAPKRVRSASRVVRFASRWRVWFLLAILLGVGVWAIGLGGQDPRPVGVAVEWPGQEMLPSDWEELDSLAWIAEDLLSRTDKLRPVGDGEDAAARIVVRIEGDQLVVDVESPRSSGDRFRGSIREPGEARRSLRRAIVTLDAHYGPGSELVAEMVARGSLSRNAYLRALSGDKAWARLDFSSAEQAYDAVVGSTGLDPDDPFALERRARLYEAMLLIERAERDLERAEVSMRERGVGSEQQNRLKTRSSKLRGEFKALSIELVDALQASIYDTSLQTKWAWQLANRERDCESANRAFGRLLEQVSGTVEVRSLAGRSISPLLMCGDLTGAREAADRAHSAQPGNAGEPKVDSEGVGQLDRALVLLTARELDSAEDTLSAVPSTSMRSWRETYEGDLAFIRGDIPAALKQYRAAAASILVVDQIRGFLRSAIARCVDGQAEEARHQAENAREIAFRRVPEADADALLTDQMMQIRGVLGMTSLAAGDLESARAESARLDAMLALRTARNGGEIKYDRYREEWAHLLAGALHVHAGERDAALARYRTMLEVRPYDEPHFLPFLERLARSDRVLAVVVDEMRAVLGFPPLELAATTG